jgi:uncharacterized protein YndB with AHSA1/START domain
VFDAWIDPESVKIWMCPSTLTAATVELDARVGGSFCIVMRDERGDFTHTGEYREIRPPQRLVFTWRSNATHNEETLVTVELFPRGDETELVLTHERLPDEPAVVSHTQGWQGILEKLAMHLGR